MKVLGLTVALLLVACGGDQGSTAPVRTDRVDLPKSYRFEPAQIEIDAGTTVTWTNNDDFPHNVHLLDGSDRTVDLPLGGTGRLTFDQPGTIQYECSLHPQQMQGTIHVR
ncbi:MAG TPA: plastocyanin/azurin family copper-binding protein [Actinomycetota bacterium]|nr:plastocyanin/azurin family copper-binding protein [Actinomycetota bacterium]